MSDEPKPPPPQSPPPEPPPPPPPAQDRAPRRPADMQRFHGSDTPPVRRRADMERLREAADGPTSDD